MSARRGLTPLLLMTLPVPAAGQGSGSPRYGLLVGRTGGSGIWHRYAAVGGGAAAIHRTDAVTARRPALLIEAGLALSLRVGRLR